MSCGRVAETESLTSINTASVYARLAVCGLRFRDCACCLLRPSAPFTYESTRAGAREYRLITCVGFQVQPNERVVVRRGALMLDSIFSNVTWVMFRRQFMGEQLMHMTVSVMSGGIHYHRCPQGLSGRAPFQCPIAAFGSRHAPRAPGTTHRSITCHGFMGTIAFRQRRCWSRLRSLCRIADEHLLVAAPQHAPRV